MLASIVTFANSAVAFNVQMTQASQLRSTVRMDIDGHRHAEEMGIPTVGGVTTCYPNLPVSVHPGVVTGQALKDLLDHAKATGYAIPAVNCVTSSSINACLEAAKKANSPMIIQFSGGGAQFFAGQGLDNEYLQASISGAVSGAYHTRAMAEVYGVPVILHTDHCSKKLLPWLDGMLAASERYFAAHGEPLFSSHMLDLSEEPLDENIEICTEYLQRMAKIDMLLEMELGITGGEEDGVNNEDCDPADLYSKPEEIWEVYKTLSKVPNAMFTVAAAFGNVHGVYAPGNVKLDPKILKNAQTCASTFELALDPPSPSSPKSQLVACLRGYLLCCFTDISEELSLSVDSKPVSFVFHGGSGSDINDIKEAISYGVIKMNIDTDTQWAYWSGIKEYEAENREYLQSQIGNPQGETKPNKNYYDPRKPIRAAEIATEDRLQQCFADLNCLGVLGGVPELASILNENNVEYSYGKLKTARKGALPI